RVPLAREILQAIGDELRRSRGIIDPAGRGGRARAAGDERYSHFLRGPDGSLHFLGSSQGDPFRIAVSPNSIWRDRLMPCVDAIRASLADAGIAKRPDANLLFLEQRQEAGTVFILAQSALDIEMIAAASQLHALIPPLRCPERQFFQAQVEPGSSEQRDWPGHGGV